jgi:hypothetical protein
MKRIKLISTLSKNTLDLASTSRVTIKIPKEMHNQLALITVESGYGLRGKSRWVRDQIEQLYEYDGRYQFILDSMIMSNSEGMSDTITLSEDLRVMCWQLAIDTAIYGSKKDEPLYLEVYISHVIRAAILLGLAFK